MASVRADDGSPPPQPVASANATPLQLLARASADGTVEWHPLLEAIDNLSGEHQERVTIDVAIDNERLLGIYRSCSSVVTTG